MLGGERERAATVPLIHFYMCFPISVRLETEREMYFLNL